MQHSDPEAVSPRMLWISAVIALLVLSGIVLLFLFGGDAQPLVESAATTTSSP